MAKYHVKQRKADRLTRYVIKIDELQAYAFTFEKGTLISRIKRSMRAVAKQLGYTPVELYNPLAMNLPELLTDNELNRCKAMLEEIKRVEQERADAENKADGSSTVNG